MHPRPPPVSRFYPLEMDHLAHCAALEIEIDRFASALGDAPPKTMVPTCPDWSVTDLAAHLGLIHRWAEHLVRVLAPARISSEEMDIVRGPPNPQWLQEGGSNLVSTLRSSEPNAPMWAWGADQHVRFWSRRQLHETLVHRADLELALGRTIRAEPDVCADGIDEFLANLASSASFSPAVRDLRGTDQTLRFNAVDVGTSWTVRIESDGFHVESVDGPSDAEISGPAVDLLLVLYRRQALSDSQLAAVGDLDLVDFWLAHSALG